MKIRLGFVTNSSSSSFILGFKNKKAITVSLSSKLSGDYLKDIRRSVMKNIKSAGEILEEYREIIYSTAYYEVFFAKERSLRAVRSKQNIYEWEKEHKDMFEKLVADRVNDKVEALKKKMEGLTVFSVVDYGDEDDFGSEMEHYLVPSLDCCLERISHH